MTHENKDYIQMLQTKGYRVTSQRLIVLDAVCDLARHATTQDVVARVSYMDSTIDRSTVYRALDVLTEVGLVTKTELGDQGKVYSVADTFQHHHLLCKSCGVILTIEASGLKNMFQYVLDTYDFEVRADHLALAGLCANCRTESI